MQCCSHLSEHYSVQVLSLCTTSLLDHFWFILWSVFFDRSLSLQPIYLCVLMRCSKFPNILSWKRPCSQCFTFLQLLFCADCVISMLFLCYFYVILLVVLTTCLGLLMFSSYSSPPTCSSHLSLFYSDHSVWVTLGLQPKSTSSSLISSLCLITVASSVEMSTMGKGEQRQWIKNIKQMSPESIVSLHTPHVTGWIILTLKQSIAADREKWKGSVKALCAMRHKVDR